ncbi:immunity protein [Bacillus velezensis]|uniref:immunity protein n=1 Tax=Bacillus velezensis TaxID=492670 RepID=UPI0034D68DD9
MGYKIMAYGGYFLFSLFFCLMDGWRPLGVFLIIGGLAYLALEPYRIKNVAVAEKIRKNTEILKNYDSEFNPDNFFSTYKTKIAYNEDKAILKVYKLNGEEINEYVVPFAQIIQSEISLDDQVISKVAKSGIIAGGLLGGGIGAAIGGLSASSTQTEMVKSITLKITVENLKNPIHYIHFLPSREDDAYEPQGYKKDGNIIQQALKNAEYWQGVMDVIIKKTSTVAQ